MEIGNSAQRLVSAIAIQLCSIISAIFWIPFQRAFTSVRTRMGVTRSKFRNMTTSFESLMLLRNISLAKNRPKPHLSEDFYADGRSEQTVAIRKEHIRPKTILS